MEIDIKKKITIFLSHGSDRSVKIKKNVVGMMFIKGASIFINLLLVPLTLNYVDTETYGIWLVLSSMIAWMSFFDIGLNNGLKNKLTEALAKNDMKLAREYVSTTYAVLTLIFFPLMFLLLIISRFVDWNSLLNLSSEVTGLLSVILIIIVYYCIQFVLSTINVVLQADQRPADASFRWLIQQLSTLIIIFILSLVTKGSLINLCLALCLPPIIILLVFNFTLFTGRYKNISPNIRCVNFKVAPSLLKLGLQFFIMRIAGVVQFQMISFFMIRYYGATSVTEYNIAYKYFSILYMAWDIMVNPVWVAAADAIAHKDYDWIRSIIRKYFKIFIGFAFGFAILLLLSQFAYSLWVGDKVSVPFSLSLWVMIYFLVLTYGSVYVMILNGAGELSLQTKACVISPIVFLCAVYALPRLGLGVEAIMISSVIANFNGFLLAPIQCRYLFNYSKKYK